MSNPNNNEALIAKVKLPTKYCNKLFWIYSIAVRSPCGRMVPPTKKVPILREEKISTGIIGGILTLEQIKAKVLFKLKNTAKVIVSMV